MSHDVRSWWSFLHFIFRFSHYPDTFWLHCINTQTGQLGAAETHWPFLSPVKLHGYAAYNTCILDNHMFGIYFGIGWQTCHWMIWMKTSNHHSICQWIAAALRAHCKMLLHVSGEHMTPVSNGEGIRVPSPRASLGWVWTSGGHNLVLIYYYISTLRLLFLRSLLCRKKKLRKKHTQKKNQTNKTNENGS